MTNPVLIALAGVARSGKDTLAAPLVAQGFVNLAFSSVIKEFFNPYTLGEESVGELRRRMLDAAPDLSEDDWAEFHTLILNPFEDKDLLVSAFTEHDADKAALRPILQRGGELIYNYVFGEYFRRVDAAWSAGKSVVNTRIVKRPEAEAWKKRGGVIYLVERAGWPAATPWEAEQVACCRRAA